MSKKERENFLRHAILIVDHVKSAMQWLIDLDLHLTGLTFEQFINEHQHEIHHLCYNDETCCKCSGETYFQNIKTLDASQLDILFDKKGKLDGHKAGKNNKSHCCRRAKRNITTKNLDFLFAKTIVAKFCTKVFWFSCTVYVKHTFREFLDENKHIIYHLWKCHNVCCKCKSEFDFPSNKPILEEFQWDLLFSCPIDPCFQHTNSTKFGNKVCAVCATDAMDVNDLDRAVQEILLTNCCKLRKVVASIDNHIQDTYKLAKEGKISDQAFERCASDTEKYIYFIAEICGKTKEVEQMLKSEIIFDEVRCSGYQIALLEAMRKERRAKCTLKKDLSFFLETKEETIMHSNDRNTEDDKFDNLSSVDLPEAEVCPDEDCGMCEEETAEYFCQDCDVKLCRKCFMFHSKLKSTREHHIDTITTFNHVKTHCNIHNTLFTQICLFHDIPICVFCLKDHKICTVDSIQKVKKGVKQSAKPKEIESKSENLLKSLKVVTSKISDEIDSIPGKTEKFSIEFDNCFLVGVDVFNQIKEYGLKQIIRHERKMKAAQKQLLTCTDKIKLDNRNFEALMKTATEHNTILGLLEIEHNFYRIENSFEKVLEDNNVSNIDITLQFSFEEIKDKVLKIEHENIKIPITISKSQIPVSNSCIDEINLEKCFSIDLPNAAQPTEIKGCTILGNGELFFVDRKNKRCICYDGKGGFLSEKILPEEPVDITFMEKSTVAITLSQSNCIAICDANTDAFILRRIKVGSGSLGGLAFHDNKLFIRVGGFGYYIIDSSGEEIRRIEIRDKYMPYVTCSVKHFYYAKWDVAKVFCCTLYGKPVWECSVSEILQPPNGLSADAKGNVFVTGSFSNNVVVISADGTKTRELISKDSGLQIPVAIAYDRTRNRLLITCSSGHAVLYSVK